MTCPRHGVQYEIELFELFVLLLPDVSEHFAGDQPGGRAVRAVRTGGRAGGRYGRAVPMGALANTVELEEGRYGSALSHYSL